MKAFEVLFWISLFIVFYTYIGYGILLYILVKIKECFRKPAPRPMPADDALPPLPLFIAAYNEEDVRTEALKRRKLEGLATLSGIIYGNSNAYAQ